jgi:hypothetical protein
LAWTIIGIHTDGSVSLHGRTGSARLPTDYAPEHLELGYAQTSYATQGRTVDTALLLVGTPTDSRGIHTPMTRGRDSNHAYVVIEDNQTALDVLSQAITRDWIQPAVARRAQLDPHRSRQAPGPGEEDEFDRLERQVHRLMDERLARVRETERTAAPGLGLAID